MTKNFRVKSGSAELAGEITGTGRCLVFLHAGVADRRMWQPQLAGLGQSYQAVAYDLRGFGETETPDEVFSHAEDLHMVLDELGIARSVLVGCSQGGRVALDFALEYPQRVIALVLIAPAVSGAPPADTFPPPIQSLVNALDEAEEAGDIERINALEAHVWLDGPASLEGRVGGTLRKLFLDMNGIALRMPDFTHQIQPASAYDRLSDLGMSTLVLWGDLDFPHVKERCQELVDVIPNAQGKEILATAHLPNLEKPEEVNELIRGFLNRVFTETRS